jgi:DNA mismatch endonuclease, patch repair protein
VPLPAALAFGSGLGGGLGGGAPRVGWGGFTADLVFGPARVAVFIDGCFWHGCPDHHRQPTAHGGYWAQKVRTNRERDRRADAALAEAGWLALRFWEHEDPDTVAAAVAEQVRARR